MTAQRLLPISTRVTHFDGGKSTHGKGTIVAYNGIEPNTYFKEKPLEAAELANHAGLMGALISGAYDKDRCPYVVQFDPSAKYPEGYKDVYEPTSINLLPRPKVGDYVISLRPVGGGRVPARVVGELMREEMIDSENYYHVETVDGVMVGPSLDDYWEKHFKE